MWRLYLVSLLAFGFFSHVLFAKHELMLSSTTAVLAFSGAATTLDVGAGYNHSVTPTLQLGGIAHFTSGAGTGLAALVGPTYNYLIQGSIREASKGLPPNATAMPGA